MMLDRDDIARAHRMAIIGEARLIEAAIQWDAAAERVEREGRKSVNPWDGEGFFAVARGYRRDAAVARYASNLPEARL